MVVLNETEWAEEMIRSRSLGKKPFDTLCRVARYYIDQGFQRRDVRHMLEVFLLQCDPAASLTRWNDSLDAAITRALKYKAINIDYIDITEPEMKRIEALSGKQIQRLAFTLLCLSKYHGIINKKSDGWVVDKDSDIMRMANINTSIKRQSLMYHNLNTAGMIQFAKRVDNTNVRVCFAESGDIVMRITDFRNLGYQYMMYHGGPYFVCQNCGVTAKIHNKGSRGRRQKYCAECATLVAVQQRVNSVMRRRMSEMEPA